MLKNLVIISQSKWYWIALITLGALMEGGALFYQYVLDELPCVLCIHVRILVMAFVLVALLALYVRRFVYGLIMTHLGVTVIAAGLFERSYMLLGTERGFVIASCNMDSGLPDWFALDQWFPSVFRVLDSCGYTPILLFGISMAEALVMISFSLLIVSSVLSLVSVLHKMQRI